jgi:hypothetical protein
VGEQRDFESSTRAREIQADTLFDEILEIADNTKGDVVEVKQADGTTVLRTNHANVHRDKLKVDARKLMVAKLRPDEILRRPGVRVHGRGQTGRARSGRNGTG